MSRGFLSGAVTGLVISAVGLSAVSVMLPPPARVTQPGSEQTPAATPPTLEAAATPDASPQEPEVPAPKPTPVAPTAGLVEVPVGSEFNRVPAESVARLPATDPSAALAPPSGVTAPSPAPGGQPPVADTAPTATPQAQAQGVAPPPVPDAEAGQFGAGVSGAGDEPVLPSPNAQNPTAPDVESAPRIAAAPAVPEPTAPAPSPAAEPAPAAQPAPESAPAPEPEPEPAPTEPAADAPSAPAAIRVPVPGGEIRAPNVRVGRLPSIGADPEPADTGPEAEQADPATLGALARYAQPFEPEPGKPLFAVILIDAGDAGLDRSTLTTFSFPVTFAVPASRPDAAQAVAAYRAAGYEAVLLVDGLPAGATAKDLEVTLSAYLGSITGTVAVMDAESGGFQAKRPLLRQLAAILGDSGHGLVTYDQGLNSAEQVATAAGVPNTAIFRTLDARQEGVATIRRYLDRAAFRAGQQGQVVMLGHSYPETVTALFSWALEGKGADVNLAPLSAILRGQ